MDWYNDIAGKPGFSILEAKVLEGIEVSNERCSPYGYTTDDREIDVITDIGSGAAITKTVRGRVNYGRRLALNIKKGASENPCKAIAVLYEYEDEDGQRIVDYAKANYFLGTTLKTIILAIDGFANESVHDVLDSPNLYGEAPYQRVNSFAEIFRRGNTINRDRPALAALPTITWANWPGVFGGGAPRDHGVLGNSFFRRDKWPDSDAYVYTGGKSLFEKIYQQVGVALFGRMDSLAKDDAGSIYDEIALALNKGGDDPLKVFSIRPFYTKHNVSGPLVDMEATHFPPDPRAKGHSWEAAEILDDESDSVWTSILGLLEYPIPPGSAIRPFINDENLSRGAGPEAALTWASTDKSQIDVMSVYMPGPDNVGHTYGTLIDAELNSAADWEDPSPSLQFDVNSPVNGIAVQAENVTARGLSKLWYKIQEDGYENAVIFALVADHGQHKFFGVDHANEQAPENDIAMKFNIFTDDIAASVERPVEEGGLGWNVFQRSDSWAGAELIFSGNGGLAQFYLADDYDPGNCCSWRRLPSADKVFQLARYLADLNVSVIDFNLEEPDDREDLKISAKSLNGEQLDFGAFGQPAAIFARISYDDPDGDGHLQSDNCPFHNNPEQINADGDLRGDACELDSDQDGIIDDLDNCPLIANPDQEDENIDYIGDLCEGLDLDQDGLWDGRPSMAGGEHPDIDPCPLDKNNRDLYPANGTPDLCEPWPGLAVKTGAITDAQPHPYAWLEFEYYRDAGGNVVNDAIAINGAAKKIEVPRVKAAKVKSPDDFLAARRNFLASKGMLSTNQFYWPDFQARLEEMNDMQRSGDVIAIMDGRKGYLALDNEAESFKGWHGGPTQSESYVPLMASMPGRHFVEVSGEQAMPVPVPRNFISTESEFAASISSGYPRNWHLTLLLSRILANMSSGSQP